MYKRILIKGSFIFIIKTAVTSSLFFFTQKENCEENTCNNEKILRRVHGIKTLFTSIEPNKGAPITKLYIEELRH